MVNIMPKSPRIGPAIFAGLNRTGVEDEDRDEDEDEDEAEDVGDGNEETLEKGLSSDDDNVGINTA